jgi:hypothetical protein
MSLREYSGLLGKILVRCNTALAEDQVLERWLTLDQLR